MKELPAIILIALVIASIAIIIDKRSELKMLMKLKNTVHITLDKETIKILDEITENYREATKMDLSYDDVIISTIHLANDLIKQQRKGENNEKSNINSIR